MNEQRNELEQSYRSEGPISNKVMEEVGPEKVELGDWHESNPSQCGGTNDVKVLGRNTLVTNCKNETDSQIPSKAPTKDNKKNTGLKRFKMFGSIRKSRSKKKEKAKTKSGTSTGTIDPVVNEKSEKDVYDFSELGNRRYIKDVYNLDQGNIHCDDYTLDSNNENLHEQLIKQTDTFNSAWLTLAEASTYSTPSNCHDKNNSNADHSTVDLSRNRSLSTLQTLELSSSGVISPQNRNRGNLLHRSRFQDKSMIRLPNQNRGPLVRTRSESTTRAKGAWYHYSNSSSSVDRRGRISHEGKRSNSVRRNRQEKNNRPPLFHNFSDTFNTSKAKLNKSRSRSRSVSRPPHPLIDEDRHDVHTPRKERSVSRSRDSTSRSGQKWPSDSNVNETPIPKFEVIINKKSISSSKSLHRKSSRGKMNRKHTDVDNKTAISELSMASTTNQVQTKYLNILRKLQCHKGLEDIRLVNESRFFCSVPKMPLDTGSDSDESSCGSSTAGSDDNHSQIVEIMVDPLVLLPTTSSLSSYSEDLSEDEDEELNESDASSSYAGDFAAEMKMQQSSKTSVTNLLTSISSRLSDCLSVSETTFHNVTF